MVSEPVETAASTARGTPIVARSNLETTPATWSKPRAAQATAAVQCALASGTVVSVPALRVLPRKKSRPPMLLSAATGMPSTSRPIPLFSFKTGHGFHYSLTRGTR